MVYDLIPFFNELDILKLRLGILDKYVDKFIIEEATVTFSGESKELCFDKNRELFKDYLDKIVYITVDDTPSDVTTHERDYYQKNCLKRGLEEVGATADDVLIFGDVDEIPNPSVLEDIIKNFDKSKVYHLAQRNFYVYMNMEEKSGKLLSITGEFPEIAEKDRLAEGGR